MDFRLKELIFQKKVYIKKGEFSINDDFFTESRLRGVFHLGQVEHAILETTGEVSVYFYDHKQIKYGLPILPDSLKKTVKTFEVDIFYSCTFCGQTVKYTIENTFVCPNCQNTEWVKASNRKVSR